MGLFDFFASERKGEDMAAVSRRMRERIVQTKVASADITITRIDEDEWFDRLDVREGDWARIK